MDILRPTMYQKVGMSVTSALHHVIFVRICHIVRNAKTVSMAQQILYAQNVLVIVKPRYIAIKTMDPVCSVVVMDGPETNVTNPVHLGALNVNNIILAHVAYVV